MLEPSKFARWILSGFASAQYRCDKAVSGSTEVDTESGAAWPIPGGNVGSDGLTLYVPIR